MKSPICVRCGNIGFHTTVAYKEHMRLFHDMVVGPVIKAHNFTGRSKSAIVEEVESAFRITWYEAGHPNPFIGLDEPTW